MLHWIIPAIKNPLGYVPCHTHSGSAYRDVGDSKLLHHTREHVDNLEIRGMIKCGQSPDARPIETAFQGIPRDSRHILRRNQFECYLRLDELGIECHAVIVDEGK